MTIAKNQAQDHLDEALYILPARSKMRLLILFPALLLLGLVAHLTLRPKIESALSQALQSNPNCPITYSGFDLSFFFPAVSLKDITIPRHCGLPAPLSLAFADANFIGMSFSPFAPTFHVESELKNDPIDFYISPGVGGTLLKFDEQKISMSTLSEFLPLRLQGDLFLNAKILIEKQRLNEVNLDLSSKNFKLPKQFLAAISSEIPNVDFQRLSLKVQSPDKKTWNISQLILGDSTSPIQLEATGSLEPIFENFASSVADLKIKLKVDPKFLEENPAVEMGLNFLQKSGDDYLVELKGPLNSAIPGI